MEFSKIVVILSVLIFGTVLILNALGITQGDMDAAKWFLAMVLGSYQIKSGIENKAKIEYGRDIDKKDEKK